MENTAQDIHCNIIRKRKYFHRTFNQTWCMHKIENLQQWYINFFTDVESSLLLVSVYTIIVKNLNMEIIRKQVFLNILGSWHKTVRDTWQAACAGIIWALFAWLDSLYLHWGFPPSTVYPGSQRLSDLPQGAYLFMVGSGIEPWWWSRLMTSIVLRCEGGTSFFQELRTVCQAFLA